MSSEITTDDNPRPITRTEIGSGSSTKSAQVVYHGDLTSIKFNGSNYLDWSKAVIIALGGRRLLGYVNGEIKAPAETDAKYSDWRATDYGVMVAINNTMLPELGRNFLQVATVRDMWLAIEATYSHKGDDERLFEIKYSIRKCTQGNRSVLEYYSELQGLWNELEACEKPCPNCVGTREKNKVFDFLMGLNYEYESVRSMVFAQLSLLPIGSVYYAVQLEETRKQMMEVSVGEAEKVGMVAEYGPMGGRGRGFNQGGRGHGRSSSDRDKLNCSHCGKMRHTKEECWDIVGRPSHIGRGKRAFNVGEVAHQTIGMQECQDLKRQLDEKTGPPRQRGKFFGKGGNKKRVPKVNVSQGILQLIRGPGPSGQQGKFSHEGWTNKSRKNGPPATSTATSPRATIDGSTPSKTTQSKILFGPYEIDTTVTTDPLITDQWICDTRAAHPTTDGKKIVVGLDCEWKPNRVRYQDNKIALLQLCIGNRCLILQLIYMDLVPDSLKAFLLDEMIIFVGVGVGGDLAKLKGHYGLKCTKSMDLQKPCNAFLGIETNTCMGLKGYAREILSFELEKLKNVTQSNWELWNLEEMQIRYACLDAFTSYLLGSKVLEPKSD